MCKPCGNFCCDGREIPEVAESPLIDSGCGCEDCLEEGCWPEDEAVSTWWRQTYRTLEKRPRRRIETVAAI